MGRLLSSSFISPSLSLSLRTMSSAAASSAAAAASAPLQPPPELQKFEADLAERLEHLSLATNPPNLNWTSDAMAVLLSTHASATTAIFPTLRSLLHLLHHHHHHDSSAAAAAARQMIGEYLDRCVGLLDVCNALKTATCQLEEHLGQLDHALARAWQACSNATANGAALMQAAGRRLGTCLPPPAAPSQAQAQAQADRPRAMSMRRSTSQPCLTEARSNRSSSLALSWQQTLAEAQLSLHQLKKRITTSPPPSHCSSSSSSSSSDPCSLLLHLLLQSLNATSLTAALLLSALTSTLMGLSSSSSSASPCCTDAWWSRSGLIMMASSHRQRRRHCCVMVSPSSVSNLGARDCRWALPLQEIQRDLVAHEAAEFTNVGGRQLDQVYVLGRTACVALRQSQKHHHQDGAAVLLVKLGIGNLAKEVGEMRESIAGLRVQTGLLCQAMAAVRAGLLEATSSSSSSSFPI